MTVTIRDVATAAGVSVATVSRALNKPEVVSVQTREKVFAAVSCLGFSKNLAAATLGQCRRSKQTNYCPANETPEVKTNLSEKLVQQLRLIKRENYELKKMIRKMGHDPNQGPGSTA